MSDEVVVVGKCSSCQFYRMEHKGYCGTGRPPSGRCHRYPPKSMESGFPIVLGNEFCGEYMPNKEASEASHRDLMERYGINKASEVFPGFGLNPKMEGK